MSIRNVVKALVYFVLLCAAFTLAPLSNAFADATSTSVAAPMQILGITISTATVISLAVSLVIPAVSALVSKNRAIAGFVTPLLAAANGFLTELGSVPDLGRYDWKAGLGTAIISYLLAVAGHYGIWKGTSTEQTLLAAGSSGIAPTPVESGGGSAQA